MSDLKSPLVLGLSWGEIVVDGVGVVKDAKLYPGGGHGWDWNETGTRHSPGIQPVDVAELIAAGATTIVLSRGMDLRLEVMPETLEVLQDKGIAVHVLETREAVRVYNELAETMPVGALLHSTC
jgi:hypothetical protein